MMQLPIPHDYRYRFTGHERVLHNVKAEEGLDRVVNLFGYKRVFVVCSKTLNTRTDVLDRIRKRLGERLVGLTDEVGEHSPLSNVFRAALAIRDSGADVIVSVGGGSVMDMCKAIQLCLSENAFDRESLLQLQLVLSEDGTEMLSTSHAAPAIRQIAIPTTLATSEWTPVSTPIDTETHRKARFVVPEGSPRAIIYDPSVLALTPTHLLLSTGIRGLDHALNTACSSMPHPFASLLAVQAIQLYVENLPLLKDPANLAAFSNCQLATWYTGMGQMSVPHGFSHWMVHIVGPMASVAHSDAACVLMLAQAKWLEGWAVEQHNRMRKALGKSGPFHEVLADLLHKLGMPTTLDDLGLTREQVASMVEPALQHPMVTRNNLRPITTAADVSAVMELAWSNDTLSDAGWQTERVETP
jgi:maleylacetate reductase